MLNATTVDNGVRIFFWPNNCSLFHQCPACQPIRSWCQLRPWCTADEEILQSTCWPQPWLVPHVPKCSFDLSQKCLPNSWLRLSRHLRTGEDRNYDRSRQISTAFTMKSCTTPEDTQHRCSGTKCGDNGGDRFKGVCEKESEVCRQAQIVYVSPAQNIASSVLRTPDSGAVRTPLPCGRWAISAGFWSS